MEKLVTIIVSVSSDFYEDKELKALLEDGYIVKSYQQTEYAKGRDVAITVHLIKTSS
jgi:hypothetical protein